MAVEGGFGVGLRTPFATEIATTARAVDWLEVTPENWVTLGGRKRRMLDACIERFAVVPHTVSLSVGGRDPLDPAFLSAIDALCRRTRAPWWSDHLCYSTVNGAYTHDLLPLPLSDEAADLAIARLAEVCPSFPDRIVDRLALGPKELEARFGLTGGHIFHGELALDQFFTMRPLLDWARYQTPIEHLYLCGNGTHPGTGLTGGSGANAAREIVKALKK